MSIEEIYISCGFLNFISLMSYWVYRCVTVHETKSEIESCLLYGFLGALISALFGFIGTAMLLTTVSVFKLLSIASNYILSLKNNQGVVK